MEKTILFLKEIVSFLKEVIALLSGYKTYIIGAITIGTGIYLKNTELILGGLSMITIRAGIAKI